jgi:leucyl-tRNA synthetase
MAEEMWELLGHPGGLQATAWPSFDPAVAKAAEITVPVQVNGKVRGRLTAPADATEDELRQLALNDPQVQAYTKDKTVLRIFVVPGGRLVSIQVK